MVHTEEWKSKWSRPEIQHGVLTKYNYLVHYPEGLQLGKYFDISQFVYIQAKYGVIIEDDVEIGPLTAILSESSEDEKKGLIKICRNAKIGAHSTIMPGVTIGENSVIGAHSFVNKDIPANVIAFGTPCKVKRELK
jgi:acetyltransferase-like isoleucine patch superfamily enzyme